VHRVVTIALTLSASLAFGTAVREVGPTVPREAPVASAGGVSIYPVATTQLPPREWTRPLRAPNGMSWPRSSGYLPGYWVGRQAGTASLTIDAARHPADALVRLYDVSGGREVAIRTAFVVGGGHFTLAGLEAGTYELRYRDLDSGALTRSQRFAVGSGELAIALASGRRVKTDPLAAAELRFADAIEPDLIGD